jgi:hypothetical protein
VKENNLRLTETETYGYKQENSLHTEVAQFINSDQIDSSKNSKTQRNSKQQIVQLSVKPKCKETDPSTV